MNEKPQFGGKCNNCGECRKGQLCHVAEVAFGVMCKAPCPALTEENLCGMVLAEKSGGLQPMLSEMLGVGLGCSMPDDGTTEIEIAEFDRKCIEIIRAL